MIGLSTLYKVLGASSRSLFYDKNLLASVKRGSSKYYHKFLERRRRLKVLIHKGPVNISCSLAIDASGRQPTSVRGNVQKKPIFTEGLVQQGRRIPFDRGREGARQRLLIVSFLWHWLE